MVSKMLSIVIPIYNVKKYLECCVGSVLNQTYKQFELILVDDGSIDGSSEICDNYAGKDSRIKVVHKANGGVSSARNAGINLAIGDYVLFIDADDYIEKDYLQTFVENCSADCDLVVCGFTYDFGTKKEVNEVEKVESLTIDDYKKRFNQLYAKSLTNSPFAKLYKRELITGLTYDKTVSLGEDLLFNLEYVSRCKKIKVVPYSGYMYNQTNVSSATRKYNTEYYDCIIKCYEKSKIFVYGKVEICGDAIDIMFCNNCINLTQLVYESKLNKLQKKEIVSTILNNEQFLAISKKYKLTKRFSMRAFLCSHRQIGLLFIYYKIKFILKRLCGKT